MITNPNTQPFLRVFCIEKLPCPDFQCICDSGVFSKLQATLAIIVGMYFRGSTSSIVLVQLLYLYIYIYRGVTRNLDEGSI